YVKPWIDKKWSSFYKNNGKYVDAFVVMSAHQKNYLHAHWGIDLEKIHIIPISLANNFIGTSKSITGETIKVASAFRMCWEKNIGGNLRVIKHLKDLGYSVQYDLFGDGPDAGQVYYLIEKYGLRDCVIYHGRV